jgi:hypothetical protein
MIDLSIAENPGLMDPSLERCGTQVAEYLYFGNYLRERRARKARDQTRVPSFKWIF